MPKLVDHAHRREQIALVACRAVARRGFGRTTVAQIAHEAGYTTGMVAHYFDSKQQIILAALRLILQRMDQRLRQRPADAPADLLGVLCEALPIDAQRRTECAFWTAFWGQLHADPQLKRLNSWVHREYRRLFARCLREHWPDSGAWPAPRRQQVLRSITAFINGITASAVSSPKDWPARIQVQQLGLQLAMLRQWASGARAGALRGRSSWTSH